MSRIEDDIDWLVDWSFDWQVGPPSFTPDDHYRQRFRGRVFPTDDSYAVDEPQSGNSSPSGGPPSNVDSSSNSTNFRADDLSCSICQEPYQPMDKTTRLPCSSNHCFHLSCIRNQHVSQLRKPEGVRLDHILGDEDIGGGEDWEVGQLFCCPTCHHPLDLACPSVRGAAFKIVAISEDEYKEKMPWWLRMGCSLFSWRYRHLLYFGFGDGERPPRTRRQLLDKLRARWEHSRKHLEDRPMKPLLRPPVLPWGDASATEEEFA